LTRQGYWKQMHTATASTLYKQQLIAMQASVVARFNVC
jgi:hypothetical protein